MIDPRRQDQQIILLQPDPHPVVPRIPHVEIPVPVQDVSDLLVLVQVLVEEHPDLVLVNGAHLVRGDGDLVAVLVGALRGEGVDVGDGGAAPVEDAEVGEVGFRDGAAGVVGLALVAGQVVVVVGFHFFDGVSGGGGGGGRLEGVFFKNKGKTKPEMARSGVGSTRWVGLITQESENDVNRRPMKGSVRLQQFPFHGFAHRICSVSRRMRDPQRLTCGETRSTGAKHCQTGRGICSLQIMSSERVTRMGYRLQSSSEHSTAACCATSIIHLLCS